MRFRVRGRHGPCTRASLDPGPRYHRKPAVEPREANDGVGQPYSAEDVPSDPIPEFDYEQSQSFDDCASSA